MWDNVNVIVDTNKNRFEFCVQDAIRKGMTVSSTRIGLKHGRDGEVPEFIAIMIKKAAEEVET